MSRTWYEHYNNDSPRTKESRHINIHVTIILIVLIYQCDVTHSISMWRDSFYINVTWLIVMSTIILIVLIMIALIRMSHVTFIYQQYKNYSDIYTSATWLILISTVILTVLIHIVSCIARDVSCSVLQLHIYIHVPWLIRMSHYDVEHYKWLHEYESIIMLPRTSHVTFV